ncbi:unnamed protein product [marine sediment metagenome]|uniref:Uncharacterized protein n=1 Tax=marine sediment metagenome TaxID=412755 RepID=X0TV07_9ZZZZ
MNKYKSTSDCLGLIKKIEVRHKYIKPLTEQCRTTEGHIEGGHLSYTLWYKTFITMHLTRNLSTALKERFWEDY